MDFELLNFWISKLGFDICHNDICTNPKFFVSLKAHSGDVMKTYRILLSENKNNILEFLGFDNTIAYNALSEKNTFEYLCTSSLLNPIHIQYCGFKGPHAKNKQHKKFDEYLKNKQYHHLHGDVYCAKEDRDHLLQRSISFFNKENEFIEYIERKGTMNKLMKKHRLLKNYDNIEWDDFKMFLILNGIMDVLQTDDDTLFTKWDAFKTQNWSGLKMLT